MKNKFRVKKFCAFFLIVCMVLELFALPGIVGVFAQNTGQTDSAASAATELVTDDAAGDIADNTAGAATEGTTDNIAGDTTDETAGTGTDETAGDTTNETAGTGTDETAGDTTDETAGSGTDETAGDTTDETAGNGTDETAGDSTDETAGTGTDETAGDSTDETAGTGTDETAGDTTDETAGSGTDETAGDATDETAGAGTDETAGAGTDESSGAGTDETAGSGTEGAAGSTAGGAAGGAAGAGTKPAAEPTKADSSYSWEAMTDEELAAWLLDEANAEEIKKILYDNTGEEYLSLRDRLETIFTGEDTELAKKVNDRLSALLESIGMAGTPIATLSDAIPDKYIYFDLAAGDVTIGGSSYSGAVYVAGDVTTFTRDRSGDEKFYIYQSTEANRETTGYVSEENLTNRRGCRVPVYDRVSHDGMAWTEYITNNTEVTEVSGAWAEAATASERTPTGYYITFKSDSEYTADVTIDNIWSSYHHASVNRTTGGIGAHLGHNTGTIIQLRLKGDNRVGCVHYYAEKKKKNQIIFSDGENESSAGKAGGKDILLDEEAGGEVVLLDDVTDAEDISLDAEANIADILSDEAEDAEYISIDEYAEGDKTPGSITVADFPDNFGANYWNAAIGGADNGFDCSDGIVIKSGVIYAGTTSKDDCTAIGGGGNNYGGVTISGGTVTAVTASTGTAIGGGIGWGGLGGDANVTISGGTVYAYNHGIGPDSGSYVSFVPAAAIGGGSASTNYGNKETTVTITGGFVYAQSVAGAAIGGGGSGKKTGGKATVNIEGGTVIAKSIGKTVNYNLNDNTAHTEKVLAGVSIGGGTGFTGGGSVTLNISEKNGKETILRTGSIGGGKTTDSGNIGSATVTITDGDITGQVIMAGGADEKCSFTMTDGRIHDTNVVDGNTIDEESFTDPQPGVKIEYLEKNGGAVWMEDTEGVTNISGGTIEGCTAELGGAIYMSGGTFNLSGTGNISGNTAQVSDANTGLGGAVYIQGGNANISGGSLGSVSAPNKAMDGGAVYVTGGIVNVSEGGSVQYNKASQNGGGIYVTGGNVTVSGGSISQNKAEERGGGVYLPDGMFTMEGGTIDGNTANIRGGGIFLRKSPTLTKGTISGNRAEDSGGGLCINGDRLELTSEEMQIYGNEAGQNGGGVAVLNGDFILNGGAVGVEDKAPNQAVKGGGVFVKAEDSGGSGTVAKANVTVREGNIWYNHAGEGGGVYLDKGEGDFTLEGTNASISHNTATDGGGIYLYKDPFLNQGKIEKNNATANGGGIYISDCPVTLNPTGKVVITGNSAQNGAGIYIHGVYSSSGGSENAGGFGNGGGSDGSVDAVSSGTPTPTHRVGLIVGSDFDGFVSFTENTATENGGAVCIDTGRFYLESDNIAITGNVAENGGGVAVLKGNFTMSAGSIGGEGGGNHAENGGGVYVSGGEVWLKGGSVKYNEATDGGGAYVTGGQLTMVDGFFTNNTATRNGGGAYVAGNFRMLDGKVGGEGGGNGAINGGGVYVSDGNVTIVYGDISHNSAAQDGGGVFVSATSSEVGVVMLSGNLSNNSATRNGGGMAVESEGDNKWPISVKIGCLLNHKLSGGVPSYPIDYEGDYAVYENFEGIGHYKHRSCPQVQHNTAGSIGGGFFLSSDASVLSFYCVEETENKASAAGQNSDGMDVVGGQVVIGDEHYHNHNHDEGQKDPHVVPWGYISMDNSTLVNGGQVDIYGDMTNPVFRDEVTVDIEDTTNDHFLDHRLSEDGNDYKVHYFENFEGTGLYQAMQYDEAHAVITIAGALFTHPGYQILGWYTKPKYDPTNEDEKETERFYPVGETFDLRDEAQVPNLGQNRPACDKCDSRYDGTLLVLYAIWEANGYTVVFEPNVPQGETYTGEMENQIHQYGAELALTKNAYGYPGHIFDGWNTKADGTGVKYADEAVVSNLTDKNGEKVKLYAQWILCDHDKFGVRTYAAEGATLTRTCSCGGQTLTATLHAEDTVYDGHSHPATLVCSDEAAWRKDKPKITYTAMWINDVHPGFDEEEDLLKNIEEPLHAGRYTATITKPDGDGADKATASVEYVIAKADQSAPEKPTYEVVDSQLEVSRVADDPHTLEDAAGAEQRARAQYRLTYYENSNLTGTKWQMMPEGGDTLPITMENAWTSYNVEVRYEELNDYNPSNVVRANAVYHYEGNVTVEIICDEGISYLFEASKDVDGKLQGATLTLDTEDGYYVVGGTYSVKKQVTTESNDGPEKEVQPGADDNYHFEGVPDNSTLTITIGTARRSPKVEARVAPGQVFSYIRNMATTISRDSAFTAAFRISNFDPCYTKDGNSYGYYTAPVLTFGSKIPQNTTIILVDRGKNGEKTYWYYRAESEVTSVPLTEFQKMGESESMKYEVPQPGQENGYIDLDYQFIVDFSQSTDGCSESSLEMTLKATAENLDTKTPEVGEKVTVSMADPSFKLEKAENAGAAGDANGLTQGINCSFSVTPDAKASKWENRASALILTPRTGSAVDALPPDARIKVEVNGATTYLYKTGESDGSFIVPLSLLEKEEKKVRLTLQSALFPTEKETSYIFDAKWMISPSKAGKAPRNGDHKDDMVEVTFTSEVRKPPSLKPTGRQRALTVKDHLNLKVDMKNMEGYTVSAALLRKGEDGIYSGTGWNQTSVTEGSTLRVPLGGHTPGSFCVLFTVKKSIDVVMEVPYYFVIKPTQ